MLQFTNRFSGHSRKWIPDFFGCPPHFMRGWHYIVGNLHISGMPHIFWRKRTSRQNLWDFKLTTINHLQWTVAIVDSEKIRTVFFFSPAAFLCFIFKLASLFVSGLLPLDPSIPSIAETSATVSRKIIGWNDEIDRFPTSHVFGGGSVIYFQYL